MIPLNEYLAALNQQGVRVYSGTGNTFWEVCEMNSLMRRPYIRLDPPPAEEVRRILWEARAPVASYVCAVDGAHPQNAWMYVCEDQKYNVDKLSSTGRRDVRKALRNLRFEFLGQEIFKEKGLKSFCNTRQRIGLTDGTQENFYKKFAHFCENPGHKILGAWAGSELAGFTAVECADDWVDFYPYAADDHLQLCPNNGMAHFILDYFLVQKKVRVVNYGLSSIQEESNAAGLHAFKKKAGFECRPVHRVFVFHPLLRPLANRFTLAVLRLWRQLAPGNPAVRKACGMLATYRGQSFHIRDEETIEGSEEPRLKT
ncbi:MAG TPA: hypothetical protein VIH42_06520 [Thermoguttaceae bacterium]